MRLEDFSRFLEIFFFSSLDKIRRSTFDLRLPSITIEIDVCNIVDSPCCYNGNYKTRYKWNLRNSPHCMFKYPWTGSKISKCVELRKQESWRTPSLSESILVQHLKTASSAFDDALTKKSFGKLLLGSDPLSFFCFMLCQYQQLFRFLAFTFASAKSLQSRKLEK